MDERLIERVAEAIRKAGRGRNGRVAAAKAAITACAMWLAENQRQSLIRLPSLRSSSRRRP